MKFINTTKNSVQLEDIEISVPYIGDQEQEIELDKVQKSRAFQKMVQLGGFKICQAEGQRLAQNLKYISDNFTETKTEKKKTVSGRKTEVIVRGHFYDNTGYAKVNRNLSFCLHRQQCVVCIDPVNNQNYLNEVETRILSMMRRPVGEKAILIDSVIPTQSSDDKCNYNILYTTAESSAVPPVFAKIANDYDELWVTSEFCKQAFYNSGYGKEISVVNPIINANLYKKTNPMQLRANLKAFRFLTVQTFGYRKGTDALLHSFCKAFKSNDDVCLVLMIAERSAKQQKKIKQNIQEILERYCNPPQIEISFKPIPEYLMPSLYSAFHAFVLTSRGEGFGLPICEAALCDLPIITVDYGGPKDFLNHSNSYLVDVDEMEIAEVGATNVYYWDQQQFPKLGDKFTSNFADALRDFVQNYNKQKQKNMILKDFVCKNLQGDRVGKMLKIRLDNIYTR